MGKQPQPLKGARLLPETWLWLLLGHIPEDALLGDTEVSASMAEDEGRSYMGSPARNITSSVSISHGSVTTSDAFELRLCTAVGFVYTTT